MNRVTVSTLVSSAYHISANRIRRYGAPKFGNGNRIYCVAGGVARRVRNAREWMRLKNRYEVIEVYRMPTTH